VSDQLLFILKLCLLALLYLFFFRVLRAVWAELKAPAPVAAPVPGGGAPAPAAAAAAATRKERRAADKAARSAPHLEVLEPAEERGRSYPLGNEASIGRAAGCQITLDDTYSSQIHARVFQRDGQWLVEDLGSTNGTWLNRHKVSGPMVLQRGDRLQIGNTVMELR
jgi:pSer/pThr/pTyr-binding forkhead associated (FHA) protein